MVDENQVDQKVSVWVEQLDQGKNLFFICVYILINLTRILLFRWHINRQDLINWTHTRPSEARSKYRSTFNRSQTTTRWTSFEASFQIWKWVFTREIGWSFINHPMQSCERSWTPRWCQIWFDWNHFGRKPPNLQLSTLKKQSDSHAGFVRSAQSWFRAEKQRGDQVDWESVLIKLGFLFSHRSTSGPFIQQSVRISKIYDSFTSDKNTGIS